MGLVLRKTLVSVVLLGLLGCGSACRDSGSTSQTTPAATADSPASSPPSRSASPALPEKPPDLPEPADPFHLQFRLLTSKQKHPGWVKVGEFFNEGQPANIDAAWKGGNRIVVQTDNVRRMELDLGQLPRDARRSTAIRLDGQGIELLSRHGPRVRFERGPAGIWRLAE